MVSYDARILKGLSLNATSKNISTHFVKERTIAICICCSNKSPIGSMFCWRFFMQSNVFCFIFVLHNKHYDKLSQKWIFSRILENFAKNVMNYFGTLFSRILFGLFLTKNPDTIRIVGPLGQTTRIETKVQ